MTATGLHPVELRALPVPLWQESRRWMQDLLREFEVIASSNSSLGVPRALLAFVADARDRFSHLNPHANSELEAALIAGEAHVDLFLRLPAEAGEASRIVADHIGRAIAFCRDGDLLVPPPSDEAMRFISWYLREVEQQLAGDPATPWGAHAPR